MTPYQRSLAEARTTSAVQQTDEQAMAALCTDVLPLKLGAISPELTWNGAQAAGLTTKQLVQLVYDDPQAATDLMWREADHTT